MKTEAFICDDCNGVFLESDVCAVIVEQPDLFKEVFTYRATIPYKKGVTVENKPDRYDIHFCLHCYAQSVTDLLKGINRHTETGQKDYDYYFKLYRQKFYERLHTKTFLRSHAANRR